MNTEKIKDLIRVLFTPSCWVQLSDFCPIHDAKLRHLMQLYDFEAVESGDIYTVRLGEEVYWFANHPYGSFTRDRVYSPLDGPRPSRATILRAHDKAVADIVRKATAKEDPGAGTPFFPQLSPASGDASGSPAVAKCVPVGDPPTLAGVYGSTDSGGVSGEEVAK